MITININIFVSFSRRLSLCIALTAASFVTVARAKTELVAAIGVALTSLGSGLGESTLLTYMTNYKRYEYNFLRLFILLRCKRDES